MVADLDETLAALGTNRLRRFVGAMIPIAGAYLALFVVFAVYWRSVSLAGGAASVLLYVIALCVARVALQQSRTARAAAVTGGGLLAMIVVGVPFLHFQLGALPVISIAALVVVLPHLDRRALLVFASLAVLVTTEVVIVAGVLEPLVAQPPRWFQIAVLLTSVIAATVLIAIMMMSDHTRLRTLLDVATQNAVVAQRSRDATDAFLVAAAHQLRTPISTVLVQAETLAAASRDRERERLERIVRQAKRLHRVVDAMLDMSRISSETLQLERATVDLSAIARAVADEYAWAAQQAGVRLDVDVPERAELVGDQRRLELLVSHLVDNAIRHGNQAPAYIAVREDGGSVVLSVRDEGPGIAAAERGRLFDHNPRPRADGGFGVGLWLARELARAMGGDLVIEPGRGAHFVARLPREGAA